MLNGDSKTVLYLSIVFSKKCNLQTGVQTFLFLSDKENRVDFSCRDVYSGTKYCLKPCIGILWFWYQSHIYLIACKFWATVNLNFSESVFLAVKGIKLF